MRVTVESSTGSRLSVLTWPDSQSERAALLVHGLASNARTWRGVAERLHDRGVNVVAVDQRGHGESEVTADGYDFDTLTADLALVTSATRLECPVVVGQSWGGNVALHYGAHQPSDVAAVVGIDGGAIELFRSFSSWEEAADRLAPPVFSGMTLEAMRSAMTAGRPDWPPAGIEDTLGNFRVRSDGTITNRLPRDKHMLILRAMYDHRPRELIDRITSPIAMLAAQSGPSSEQSVSWFPNVKFVDGDHDLHVQQPDLVADFISEVAGWH